MPTGRWHLGLEWTYFGAQLPNIFLWLAIKNKLLTVFVHFAVSWLSTLCARLCYTQSRTQPNTSLAKANSQCSSHLDRVERWDTHENHLPYGTQLSCLESELPTCNGHQIISKLFFWHFNFFSCLTNHVGKPSQHSLLTMYLLQYLQMSRLKECMRWQTMNKAKASEDLCSSSTWSQILIAVTKCCQVAQRASYVEFKGEASRQNLSCIHEDRFGWQIRIDASILNKQHKQPWSKQICQESLEEKLPSYESVGKNEYRCVMTRRVRVCRRGFGYHKSIGGTQICTGLVVKSTVSREKRLQDLTSRDFERQMTTIEVTVRDF